MAGRGEHRDDDQGNSHPSSEFVTRGDFMEFRRSMDEMLQGLLAPRGEYSDNTLLGRRVRASSPESSIRARESFLRVGVVCSRSCRVHEARDELLFWEGRSHPASAVI
ncbi:hypothetical protein KSP39_PZI021299 [Platanthera zijinensis]|uniref:Uncharacterized protein n=1 Tax=Platanthera zijinensis TaxID=2320716 RepID=A0AAP0AXR8_9ASPA